MTQSDAAVQLAKAAIKDSALQAQARIQQAPTSGKLKLLGTVVGIGVLGIALMALVAKLWAFAIGAVVLGGIATAGYVVLKPKVLAIKTAATDQLLAGQRAEQEAQTAAQAAAHQASAAQKLEDELASLKKRV